MPASAHTGTGGRVRGTAPKVLRWATYEVWGVGLAFEKSGMVLGIPTRNFLAIKHARTTETVVGALRSHVYICHSATTCGLELAHALLLANTHPLNCHCP